MYEYAHNCIQCSNQCEYQCGTANSAMWFGHSETSYIQPTNIYFVIILITIAAEDCISIRSEHPGYLYFIVSGILLSCSIHWYNFFCLFLRGVLHLRKMETETTQASRCSSTGELVVRKLQLSSLLMTVLYELFKCKEACSQ